MSVVEDSRLAQSQQSELVRREKEATQAVKKLEADLFAERADHSRQVNKYCHGRNSSPSLQFEI